MRTLIEERARKVYSEVFPELTAATARDVRNGGGAPFLPYNAGYNSYEMRASNASSISHPIISKNNGNPHVMNSHGMTAASINSSNCTSHTFNSLGMQKSSVSSSNCTNNTVNSQGMRASVNSSNFTSSDDEESQNDSTSSPVHLDAIQQKPGQKRKRTAPTNSFDYRFNYLMAFKAKYGHCNVSFNGEDASLAKWCTELRGSYKKMQNNQKPHTKLAHAQIQCLTDAGFKWSLKVGSDFDKRFNDLMAFKAKCGHCHVPFTGQNASLGQWCSEMRVSYKKIQNNQKPINKLSDEQIQRLNDAGFKWSLQALKRRLVFDKHFNDLMSFKAKYGHCDVPQRGENASFGKWCNLLRVSYKKIQNNQTPNMKLSDEQIQRLNDLGFKWCR
jgi:hypothetical protein